MQLHEQYINFIADHVHREIKETFERGDYMGALDIYLEFLQLTNKTQYDYVDIEMIMASRADKQEFIKDIVENGIYVHEPPFVGNTEFEDFIKIYEKHPEWVADYHCEGIEKPLVIGDEYFIRLKHESSNKMSIRSTGMLNIKNQPSKSALKKEKKAFLNDNAIRLGEMESENLLITRRPDLVSRLFRTYSTEAESREDMITKLLTAKDPFNLEIKGSDNKSITRQMLDKYLMVLELGLEDE